MKHAFCICMALAMGLCAFCAQKMTAEELDRLVDQYVQCEHPDFVRISIDELKAAGRLTEPELAEAFYRGVLRFNDCKGGESRLNKSLFWLSRTLPEERLGKLRDLALSYTNALGRIAVCGYFKRMEERPECLGFLCDVLRLNPAARGTVWGRCRSYLESQGHLKRKTSFRQDILSFVERHAEEVPSSLSCDEILCRHLEGYVSSARRRDRIARVLENPEIKSYPELMEYFQRELNKVGRQGK